MDFLLLFPIFVFGLLIGSFLNLVIDRVPRGEQVLRGRSRCDSCGKVLGWYDLVPLFSWLFLRGRCRYCHSPIPWRNPAVEIASATLFVLVAFHLINYQLQDFTAFIEALIVLFIISSLLAIFFIDLEQKIIPNTVIYPAILLAGFYRLVSVIKCQLLELVFLPHCLIASMVNPLFSALGAAGFFLLLIMATRGRGMGWGDVKLAFLLGLFLGFPKVLFALYFAFLTGGFLSVMLIMLGRKKFGQTIAFGPFLVLGTLLTYFEVLNFIGEKIW